MFTQTRFLGSSVVSFNANMGWGDSPSTLTVKLVDDFTIGDKFTRPDPGAPVVFNYEGWIFGGIIQAWTIKASTSENPVYEVTVVDPREILNGVQLILAGYTGTVSVSNLLNIYGYLEKDNFGDSGKNQAGISANLIRSTIKTLTSGNSSYGSYINLEGNTYIVNLDALPSVPDYYRIPNDNMSLMEYVRLICDDTNHDYHFSMRVIGGFNQIILNVINRNIKPLLGAINQFVSDVDGANSKDVGFEFANEVTSKFLVGGEVSKLYFQYPEGGEDDDFETDPWDNTIWPFWGYDKDQNVIIGDGLRDEHTFVLDIRHLDIPELGDTYPTDIGELRAALTNQDAWETFLEMRNTIRYIIDAEGSKEGNFTDGTEPFKPIVRIEATKIVDGQPQKILLKPVVSGSDAYKKMRDDLIKKKGYEGRRLKDKKIKYSHAGKLNPHFGKADKLDLNYSTLFRYVLSYFLSEIDETDDINDLDFSPTNLHAHNAPIDKSTKEKDRNGTTTDPTTGSDIDSSEVKEEKQDYRLSKIYAYIRSIADQYYGKKFMVKVPFVESVRDEETNIITSNFITTNGAYLDEDNYKSARQNNLIPVQFIDNDSSNGFIIDPRIMSIDGRFFTYVRFDNIEDYDYSDIPSNSIIVNDQFSSVFIRCRVDKEYVYQDKDELYSPRALVTMPGRVTFKPITDNESYQFHTVVGILYPSLKKKFGKKEAKEKATSIAYNTVGSDTINFWEEKNSLYPNLAVLPILSKIDRYGPWLSQGGQGKTEYEQDDSLVPWNYGSWDLLNNAASSKVDSAISNYQVSENGSIIFPGVPAIQLGAALVASGPYVTNVSVNVSDKVTTTYTMNTWKSNPYKLSKHKEDFISRLSKKQNRIKRDFAQDEARDATDTSDRLNLAKTIAELDKPNKKKTNTSHPLISSQKIGDKYPVVFQPSYNAIEQVDQDHYEDQVFASIDSLFVPFSNYQTSLPGMSGDYATELLPNASSLFPYKEGNFSTNITYGDDSTLGIGVQDGNFDSEKVRGMAHKGPMIMAGWGINTFNNPVPNSGITYSGQLEYHPEYLNPIHYKVGPVELFWDDRRELWSGGSDILVQVIDELPELLAEDENGDTIERKKGELPNKNPNAGFYGETEDNNYVSNRYYPKPFNRSFNPSAKQRISKLLYVRQWDIVPESEEVGSYVYIQPTDNYTTASSFSNQILEPSGLWVAKRVNGRLVLDNQSVFFDYTYEGE